MFILLMHFRFSICEAFDPAHWVKSTVTVTLTVETKGFEKGECEASSPSAVDFIFQNLKSELWWSRLGIDKNDYFAVTISWHIFGGGKKCSHGVRTLRTLGAWSTSAWVPASCRGPGVTKPLLSSPWAVGALLHFQAGYDPWLFYSRRQREHLCYALTVSGVVTIN